MKLSPGVRVALMLGLGAVLAIGLLTFARGGLLGALEPSALSTAHEHLQDDCAACHAPYQRLRRGTCVTCHSTMPELLRREATAFHAWVPSCVECHAEHEGPGSVPTRMEHEAVGRLLAQATDQPPEAAANLYCASCHGVEDVHRGLFGDTCDSCHGLISWEVADYRHPGSRSRDCNACHAAPPSHLMGHFAMVSAAAARKPDVPVESCWGCHETSDWNDIVGIGWYDHH